MEQLSHPVPTVLLGYGTLDRLILEQWKCSPRSCNNHRWVAVPENVPRDRTYTGSEVDAGCYC